MNKQEILSFNYTNIDQISMKNTNKQYLSYCTVNKQNGAIWLTIGVGLKTSEPSIQDTPIASQETLNHYHSSKIQNAPSSFSY